VFYKKILKLKPDHEHALIQAAEIAGSQGLYADARGYLHTVAERRKARGDARGAAQMLIRLGSLDPADFDARIIGASARVQIGDTKGAVEDLKAIAAELTEKGRQPDAIDALRQAAQLDPEDAEIRERLLQVYIAAGDFASARACATTVDEFKGLAASLEAAGQETEALAALREASRLAPEDTALQAHLARAFVARGDLAAAAEYLTVENAGADPQLLMTVAEIRLRDGRIDEGLDVLRRLLADDPERREAIAMLGWKVAEDAPDVGFRAVELAADAGVAQSDWPSAAAALQEFVTRVPNSIPALMRLVEICVDGGLEATMYSAQAQLADAYIAAGSAAEARVIAEDLVAREPWDRANVERFRRALELMGEPDPDALIADRLSGQSPFMSTDFSMASDDLPPFEPEAAAEPEPPPPPPAASASARPVEPPPPPPIVDETAGSPAPEPRAAGKGKPGGESTHFQLSANAIDLDSFLGELEARRPPARVERDAPESVEVDLSVVLDDIKRPAATPAPPADLDGVFERLRGDAARRVDAANEDYKRGLALHKAGKIDAAIDALQAASRAPKLRFATASLLGRTYKSRGMTAEAIEWFERAAAAPAPSPDDAHLLLYELAEALESAGEVARALAISLQLQADAGEYRDIGARVDRLAKVQARG
jgi:tetratricopeptide (TPR) repeat protein